MGDLPGHHPDRLHELSFWRVIVGQSGVVVAGWFREVNSCATESGVETCLNHGNVAGYAVANMERPLIAAMRPFLQSSARGERRRQVGDGLRFC